MNSNQERAVAKARTRFTNWILGALLLASSVPVSGNTVSPLPPAEVGVACSVSLVVDGGAASAFQLIKGELPAGLMLSTGGLISGVPIRPGSARFTVTALDKGGGTVTSSYKIKTYSPVAIATTELKACRTGTAYVSKLKAKRGTKPYFWSVVEGDALPAGLWLDKSSGVIQGTPITYSPSMFTIRVTDAAGGTALQLLSLVMFSGTSDLQLGPWVCYLQNDFINARTIIGDLNGDGRNDVVVAALQSGAESVLIYYQNSYGGLESPVILRLGVYPVGVVIADVNHDGKEDLLISGSLIHSLGGFAVFYQDPVTGQLLPEQDFAVSSTSARELAVGDVNSDGLNDIVVVGDWDFDPQHAVLSVRYQNADGTLAPEFVYDELPIARKVRIADMNHDGHNDLVLAIGPRQFAVVLQDATTLPGVLSTNATFYDVPTTYFQVYDTLEVADLNADGWPDVVTLAPGNGGFVSLFRQNAQGTLDAPEMLVQWSNPPGDIAIADINGDGLNDICNSQGWGYVFVHFQAVDHSFSAPAIYEFPVLSSGVNPLSIGDVTGDGHPDAVLYSPMLGLCVLPNH